MTVYMRVSLDKYELPDAVSESIIELANICGVSWRTIYRAVYGVKRTKGRPKYVAVQIGEGDDD